MAGNRGTTWFVITGRASVPEKDKAFEALWETSLHDGFMAGTALPAISVSPRPDFVNQSGKQAPQGDANRLEIVFRPDPSIGDGKFANNGWLQELPKPVTRLTWDNAAMISPGTAQRIGADFRGLREADLRQPANGSWGIRCSGACG